MGERKLTAKQERFVAEYLVDLNATQAAIRAGYSAKTAEEQGYQLLRKTSVAKAIAEQKRARAERTEVTADRVVDELAALSLYDPAALVDVMGPADIAKLPEATRRAIIGWSWDKQGRFVLKLSPKTPSLDLLGRHLGMFRDRIEHSGPDGGPIEMNDTEVAAKVAGLLALAEARSGSEGADED